MAVVSNQFSKGHARPCRPAQATDFMKMTA
jgi:hypothetical protein